MRSWFFRGEHRGICPICQWWDHLNEDHVKVLADKVDISVEDGIVHFRVLQYKIRIRAVPGFHETNSIKAIKMGLMSWSLDAQAVKNVTTFPMTSRLLLTKTLFLLKTSLLKIQNTYFQNTNKYQKDPDMKIDILQAVKYLSITHFWYIV